MIDSCLSAVRISQHCEKVNLIREDHQCGRFTKIVNNEDQCSLLHVSIRVRITWKGLLTSRISDRGNRIGAVFQSVCAWVCRTYVVHHFNGKGLLYGVQVPTMPEGTVLYGMREMRQRSGIFIIMSWNWIPDRGGFKSVWDIIYLSTL